MSTSLSKDFGIGSVISYELFEGGEAHSSQSPYTQVRALVTNTPNTPNAEHRFLHDYVRGDSSFSVRSLTAAHARQLSQDPNLTLDERKMMGEASRSAIIANNNRKLDYTRVHGSGPRPHFEV